MNKFIKISLLTIITFFFFLTKSYASNKIKDINMNIYINKNGHAQVTEVWKASLHNGTEGYRSFTNLNSSSISNFSVIDDSGTMYQRLDGWVVSAPFYQKKYKSGFHMINNGIELCWGISKYGNRTYTLKYTISNFVKQYTDKQGIYFNLLNLDQDVDHVKITISSYEPLSLDNSRIWGFGYDGTINFKNGKIVLDSSGKLSSSEYMVALVRFNEKLFDTDNIVPKSFDQEYDNAFIGVDDTVIAASKKNKIKDFIYNLAVGLFKIGKVILAPVLLIIFVKLLRSNNAFDNYTFSFNNMEEATDDKEYYYRDIPCNNDLEVAYWIAYQYRLVPDNELRKGLISAYFTKWIQKGYIKVIDNNENERGYITESKYAFDLTNQNKVILDTSSEQQLMQFLVKAAKGNNILQEKEFYKWSKENFREFDLWYTTTLTNAKVKLSQQGLIYENEITEEEKNKVRSVEIMGVKQNYDDTVTDQVNEYANNINGFRNFMINFSSIEDKHFFEVHIFDDYLVFASLLGIAEKVEKQFKKLYPDYFTRYQYDSSVLSGIVSSTFRNYINAANEQYKVSNLARSSYGSSSGSHDYSGGSSYSGGGGSSFSGGGGSAGGSSGGGFR